MDRREMLSLVAATLSLPGVSRFIGRATEGAAITLGLQLYTVRDALARDFEGTLERVARIGFREVEFAGYFGKSAREARAALDAVGLRAPSAHIGLELLNGQWRQTLDDARQVGHVYLVVPWIPEDLRRTLADYRHIAAQLNAAGEQSRAAGVALAYHNHAFELEPLQGVRPYDVLLEECEPSLVAMQMDVYWLTKGGGDPIDYFARHPARFPMMHAKDSAGPPAHEMVDVGRGVIDWKRVMAVGERAGVRRAFVEHDNPADAFATARAGLDFLRRIER